MWGISIIDMSTGDMSNDDIGTLATTLHQITGMDYWYTDGNGSGPYIMYVDEGIEVSSEKAIEILRNIINKIDEAKVRFAKYL